MQLFYKVTYNSYKTHFLCIQLGLSDFYANMQSSTDLLVFTSLRDETGIALDYQYNKLGKSLCLRVYGIYHAHYVHDFNYKIKPPLR